METTGYGRYDRMSPAMHLANRTRDRPCMTAIDSVAWHMWMQHCCIRHIHRSLGELMWTSGICTRGWEILPLEGHDVRVARPRKPSQAKIKVNQGSCMSTAHQMHTPRGWSNPHEWHGALKKKHRECVSGVTCQTGKFCQVMICAE